METRRIKIGEPAVLVEDFLADATVTIELWDLSDGSVVALDDNACPELVPEFYAWAVSNITTPPTTYTEYLYQMSDTGNTQRYGAIVFYEETPATGAEQVTITVEDAQGVPIVGVEVQVFNSDQSVLIDKKKTDSNGQVVFALDDGAYKVRLAKVQCTFTVPEDLTVSGTTAETFIGTPLVIASPADSSVCRVFGYAFNQAGSAPLSELRAYATITSLPMSANNKMHVGAKVQATYDPSTGLFHWDIIQGAVCAFKCDDLGISYTRTVPASPTARLSSISA
jgi:5-hydroxyisourate hydrolase-like protein (transthyretin family)